MDEQILVVDDEPFILRSLTFVLRKAGYDVLESWNGEEALETIRRVRPRLVFLDVMMPRMSGYEVCEAVRAEPWGDEITIIMLTAKGQESDRERGLEAGADEYMTKPFSPSGIVDKVRSVLRDPTPDPT